MAKTKQADEAAGAVPQEVAGPESEKELLGCQEGLPAAFAVASESGLRLRKEPSLDADILVALPQGDGVFCDGEPGPEGWLHVRTGRLEGWMLAKHLDELPFPELTYPDG